MKKKFLILDESGIFIKNALGGSKDLSMQNGTTTGGAYGYIRTVMGVIERFNPDHIISAADAKRESLKRKEIFPAYKENRNERGIDIKDYRFQKNTIIQFQKIFNIPRILKEGYEADDVIASLATQLSSKGHEVIILSSDKDFVQLINDTTKLVRVGRNDKTHEFEIIDNLEEAANVLEIDPKLAVDYQGIVGDTADK